MDLEFVTRNKELENNGKYRDDWKELIGEAMVQRAIGWMDIQLFIKGKCMCPPEEELRSCSQCMPSGSSLWSLSSGSRRPSR